MDVTSRLGNFADRAAREAGRPRAFAAATVFVLAWLAVGPLCGFSDTWQITMGTAASVLAFLMVFLIQHAQNRDTAAIQLKLDELIRATDGARNRLIALEGETEEAVAEVRAELGGR